MGITEFLLFLDSGISLSVVLVELLPQQIGACLNQILSMRSESSGLQDQMDVRERQLLTGTSKAVAKHMASYQVLLDEEGVLTFWVAIADIAMSQLLDSSQYER
jgi:hypothetical protein